MDLSGNACDGEGTRERVIREKTKQSHFNQALAVRENKWQNYRERNGADKNEIRDVNCWCRFYLSVRFFLTVISVFRKPNAIPLCFSIDLVLSFLSWLLVRLISTVFLDVPLFLLSLGIHSIINFVILSSGIWCRFFQNKIWSKIFSSFDGGTQTDRIYV